MAMEMVMAARVLSGLGGGAKSAGSVFRSGGAAAISTATGAGAAASSFSAGFASKFKGNSYVRDAGGGGRFPYGPGAAAWALWAVPLEVSPPEMGPPLPGESISSVASRPEGVSGAIAGDIADRSLQNYIPQLTNYSLAGDADHWGPYPHYRHWHSSSGGCGARGSTVPTPAAGEEGTAAQAAQPTGPSQIDYYSAGQYEVPEGPYSVVTAAGRERLVSSGHRGGQRGLL